MTEKDFLASYNVKDFDAPLCSVDMAIFAVDQGDLKVLLVKRSGHPFKDRWALPGGFSDLAKDTSIEDTAFRKLFEKTGFRSPYLEQVSSVGNADRDPRGWSITILYFALVDFTKIVHNTDAMFQDRNQWMPLKQALSSDLAFDHKDLIAQAINRLRSKARYTALPIKLMPPVFTLTELQHMFELLLGAPLDKKAFRRRLDSAGILHETGEMRPTTRRPAALYCVNDSFEDSFIFPGVLDAKPEML